MTEEQRLAIVSKVEQYLSLHGTPRRASIERAKPEGFPFWVSLKVHEGKMKSLDVSYDGVLYIGIL